jgi:hypothetical protein
MKTFIGIVVTVLMPFTALLAQKSVEVTLAGFKNVPPVHSSGSGLLTVTLESDTLYIEGEFEDLRSNYRSSSIHYGSARETGNRLLGLKVHIDEDRRGGSFKKDENFFALRPSLREALSQGNLYISIASDMHPKGEIRGQIPPIQ